MSDRIRQPVNTDKFYAPRSYINTWYYMINRFFWFDEKRPDMIAVLFFEDGLADGNPIEIGRLAWSFTSPRDWSEVASHDLTSSGDRLDFMISSRSVLFVTRDRLKHRLLRATIPGYETYQQQVLATNAATSRGKRAKTSTYHTLNRLIDGASMRGTTLCFVAFPTLAAGEEAPYVIAPELEDVISRAGMSLVDLRTMPGMTADLYDTRTHLNERGRDYFSRYLAAELCRILSAGKRQRPQP
jgi:hypothetical protein